MLQRIKVHNPYTPRDAYRFTHAASTPSKRRQWLSVYKSARSRGYSEPRAIMQASGVVGRNPSRRQRHFRTQEGEYPILRDVRHSRRLAKFSGGATAKSYDRHQRKLAKRNGSFSRASPRAKNAILPDVIAWDVLGRGWDKTKKFARKVMGSKKSKRRNETPSEIRQKYAGQIKYMKDTFNHRETLPMDYGEKLLNITHKAPTEALQVLADSHIKFVSTAATVELKRRGVKSNPHLALIGAAANPKKEKTTMAKRKNARDAKGRFIKASSVRRKANRKRVKKNAALKIRTKRVVTIKYRNRPKRRAEVMTKKTNRKHHSRHHRNPVARRTRRNPSMESLTMGMNTAKVKTILYAGAGAFLGSKAVSIVPNLIFKSNTDSNINTVVKVAVGLVGTGLAWKASEPFGLGFGLGAFASWTDQLFNWLWGFQSTYTGISGLADFTRPGYKLETPGWGAAPAIAGMGAGSRAMSRSL